MYTFIINLIDGLIIFCSTKMDCDDYECTTLAKSGDCVNLSKDLSSMIMVSFYVNACHCSSADKQPICLFILKPRQPFNIFHVCLPVREHIY